MPKPTNHGEIIGRLAAMDRLLCHLAHKVQDAGRAAKSAALAQEAPDVLQMLNQRDGDGEALRTDRGLDVAHVLGDGFKPALDRVQSLFDGLSGAGHGDLPSAAEPR